MNTETTYLGLRLAHPFIAGASPFGYRVETVRRLEDAGASAVVLHSLFEEQITFEEQERVAGTGIDDPAFAGVLAEFPAADDYPLQPEQYAEHIHRVKRAVSIPVIGSLNGRTTEAWVKFASIIEQAGADALELNMYNVVTDLDASSAQIERDLVDIVRELKRLLKIPVAIKLSPFFAAIGNVAHRLDEAGVDGLVLFNRFYQPDIDIRTLRAVPIAELSTSAELLLRLRWVAILHGRVRPSLAVSGGVATPQDGIKAVLAGADAVQMVSALLKHGPSYLIAMRRGLEEWLRAREAESLDDMKGVVSLQTTRDPGVFERAHYIRTLQSWKVQLDDRRRPPVK